MANEFGEMFDRVQQERVEAARTAEKAAEEARSQSRRDFDTKAACLINVVLPTLEDAKAGFSSKGLTVEVVTNTRAEHVAAHVEPIVRFNFIKSPGSTLALNVDERIIYVFSVSHTQGGVQVYRESKNHHQTINRIDLSKQFGVAVADNLTREVVMKVIEAAFRSATA